MILFPTGRPPSRGWWPVVWLSVVCSPLLVVGSMFDPGNLSDALRSASGPGVDFGVRNPVGISALGGLLTAMNELGRLGAFLLSMVAAVGLVDAPALHLDGRLQDMEDRIAALGGSLTVNRNHLSGRIPLGDQVFLAASQAAVSRSGSNFDFEM